MNISEHILLTSAHAYPRRVAAVPDGWLYDTKAGAWKNPETGVFMVHDPNSPRCETKKNDLETGEDAKGQ